MEFIHIHIGYIPEFYVLLVMNLLWYSEYFISRVTPRNITEVC